MTQPPPISPSPAPTETTVVRRARVESIILYEVKENELELLANGSPSGLFLNFSIFLLSLAFTSVATLLTAIFENEISRTLFMIFSVTGFFGGFFLLIMWYRSNQSIAEVVRNIRSRIPPEMARTPPKGIDAPQG
jgi:uncharacterized membrane-anchored protein